MNIREKIARCVCGCAILLVVALAHAFATKHNPRSALASEPRPPANRPVAKPGSETAPGREVYAAQNCASCHSIAGEGNPRHPLDGVGSRRTRDELREWITGTGTAAIQLSPAVVKRKERYQSLPAGELEALVVYLGSLTVNEPR